HDERGYPSQQFQEDVSHKNPPFSALCLYLHYSTRQHIMQDKRAALSLHDFQSCSFFSNALQIPLESAILKPRKGRIR
ncbi:MAG: hypothetical protein IKX21_04165, partial [Deltaproteobacteria bacterium]|nr:hypothetical protein [Deltaproteobacteria bacterium]